TLHRARVRFLRDRGDDLAARHASHIALEQRDVGAMFEADGETGKRETEITLIALDEGGGKRGAPTELRCRRKLTGADRLADDLERDGTFTDLDRLVVADMERPKQTVGEVGDCDLVRA